MWGVARGGGVGRGGRWGWGALRGWGVGRGALGCGMWGGWVVGWLGSGVAVGRGGVWETWGVGVWGVTCRGVGVWGVVAWWCVRVTKSFSTPKGKSTAQIGTQRETCGSPTWGPCSLKKQRGKKKQHLYWRPSALPGGFFVS